MALSFEIGLFRKIQPCYDEIEMSQNVAKSRPHGRRVSQAEVQKRLDFVERALEQGVPRFDLVAACKTRFGIATRTVDAYIKRVHERWAEIDDAGRDERRISAERRLRRYLRIAEERGQWSAVARFENLLAKIGGYDVYVFDNDSPSIPFPFPFTGLGES